MNENWGQVTSTQARGMYSSTAYAPFGEQYATYPTAGSLDPSYTGQNSDAVPSLYDFAFRKHSMSQGRWISPDPIGTGAVSVESPQTWNRYSYVANSPLNFIDPLGLFRAFPGQCEGGEGLCSWEGGGTDPSSIGGGLYFEVISGYWPGDGGAFVPTTISFINFLGGGGDPNWTDLTNWVTGRTTPNTQYTLVRVFDCYAPGDAVRSSTYDLVGPPGVDTSNAVITEHLSNPDVEGNGSQGVGAFQDQIGPGGATVTEGTLRYFTVTNGGASLGLVPVQYANGATYAVEGIWFNGDTQNPSNSQVFVNGSQADTMLAGGSCQN